MDSVAEASGGIRSEADARSRGRIEHAADDDGSRVTIRGAIHLPEGQNSVVHGSADTAAVGTEVHGGSHGKRGSRAANFLHRRVHRMSHDRGKSERDGSAGPQSDSRRL